jgi:ribonucleoside-diphosphate reductase alpha chain
MNDFAQEIFNQNYKGPNENVVADMWKRIATTINIVEKEDLYKDFYKLLEDFKFIPGGRILANLGIPGREATTLYNCFVHQVADIKMKDPDSIPGIYDMLKYQAETLKSEGGYGTNFSWIRPNGSYIKGIASRTPGVLRFMELWDKSSDIITSGTSKKITDKRPDEKNKIRKGAQMAVLSVWHPEILDFIDAKLQPNYLSKFNLSVGVTDGFMEALLNDEDWNLEFPNTEIPEYKKFWNGHLDEWKEKGYATIVYETIKASELWEKIMKATYSRNDPGVLFLDLFNHLNPLYYAESITASNPCGEIGMSTGVCNLGSLNLVKFVKADKDKQTIEFDFDEYRWHVAVGTRFLDNINDISRTPLPEYQKAIREKRRIGLGNMGLGSLHYMLGIKFGSEESLKLIKKIYTIKAETEVLTSAQLGKEKGSFELFNKDKYFISAWWKNLKISKKVKDEVESIGEMRNSHQSMNAPTGNTSILAGQVSGGVEPVFLKEYTRWSIVPEFERAKLLEEGLEFPNIHKGEWSETKHFSFTKRGEDQILQGSFNGVSYEVDQNRGLIKATEVVDYGWEFAQQFYTDKKLKELEDSGVFCTTNDLLVEDHINTLSIVSQYTNQNNSKTINIPNDYPYESFKDLYLNAWKLNIKGITTYRAGTMTVVLEDTKSKKSENITSTADAPKRPKRLPADFYTISVKGDRYLFAIGLLNNKPYEIFGGIMDNGMAFTFRERQGWIEKVKRRHYKVTIGDDIEIEDFSHQFTPVEQGIFRLISTNMRHGIPIKYVVEQLQKSTDDMFSLATAGARVLKKYVADGEKATGTTCPTCDSTELMYTDGCITCAACGWSKCN